MTTMSADQKVELWKRLCLYRFANLVQPSLAQQVKAMFSGEDPFTRAFAAKIAKKHGWTPEFAFLAIREYKKFVYLGVTSHYDVTPSKVIDIVWHEHQLFTRGYRDFCDTVLGRHFDHVPELVPIDEQMVAFNSQYYKVVDFYKHEFGVSPPPEIWGTPKFDRRIRYSRSVTKPERKRDDAPSADSDMPLYTMFQNGSDSRYAPVPVVFDSDKGGGFGGAGASDSWANTSSVAASEPSAPSCSSSSCGGGCGSE